MPVQRSGSKLGHVFSTALSQVRPGLQHSLYAVPEKVMFIYGCEGTSEGKHYVR